MAPATIAAISSGTQTRAEAGGRRPRRRLKIGIALLLLAAVAAGGAWSFAHHSTGTAAPPTATVVRGDLEQSLTALGSLQPKDYVDVGTQVSGQLKVIHVTYGSEVQAGDLLAEIDPTVYSARVDSDRAQLNILQAQLAEQRAQLLLAQQQNARNQRLYKANAISEDVLQTGEANQAVAQAQIAALQAQLEQAQSALDGDLANLRYTKIYAPMAGTVVSISAKQGQTLNANQSAPIILRIADLDTMTVWAQVAEADVVKIHPDMPVHFSTLGMPDHQWQGAVRQILPTPEVNNDVILYDVLIDVANPDHLLMTQMSAQVFFVLAEAKNALLVPVAALEPAPAGTDEAGPGKAYLVRLPGAVGPVTREIRVGLSDRATAEVVAGLAAGERVLLPLPKQGNQSRAPAGGSLPRLAF